MAYVSTGFEVLGMLHATSIVDDLDWTRRFYDEAFGARTMTLPFHNGRNAATSFLGDTVLETLVAAKYHESPIRRLRQSNGEHWALPCLAIDDTQDFLCRMRNAYGWEVNTWATTEPVQSATQAAPAAGGGTYRLLLTHPWDTGIEWELCEVDRDAARTPAHLERDPRWAPDWTPHPVGSDVTSVERHAVHTIVVDDPAPAREFLVHLCGGRPFHRDENPAFGTQSEYISLGTQWPTTIELATPIRDGSASRDLDRVGNTYHCLTFEVGDLDRTRAGLAAFGLGFETDRPDHIVLDPKQRQGLRYGFVAELVPGDRRGLADPEGTASPVNSAAVL